MIDHRNIVTQVSTGLDSDLTALWDEGEFDVNTWATSSIGWQDISRYVESISIRAGQPAYDSLFRVGVANVTLLNESGVFDPLSGHSVWGIPFRPGRFIRIYANVEDTPIGLFFGTIDSAGNAFRNSAYQVRTSVACYDGLGTLAAINLPALEESRGVENSLTRLEAILQRAEIPVANLDGQTGLHTMQGGADLAQNLLEEAARVAEAEGGAFWASNVEGAEGGPGYVFRSRDWLTTDERSTTLQACFGHEGEAPSSKIVGEPVTTWELSSVKNHVSYSRTGGTLQTVSSPTSIQQYGLQTGEPKQDLKCNTDEQALFLAQRTLDTYSELRPRIPNVTIDNISGNDDLHFALDFGDLVSFQVRTPHGWHSPDSSPGLAHVVGITRNITADSLTTTFDLDQSIAELS